MKIIPVIDILNKKVVHAIGGKRSEYKSLKSSLFSSDNPINMVLTLEKLGFKEIYLADLDSIINNNTNFKIFEQIRDSSKIELIVDAGVNNKELATSLFNRNIKKVIIGTETLTSINFLKGAVQLFGNSKIIVSLDLRGEKMMANFSLGDIKNPFDFIKTVEPFGISQIIILDLMRVGCQLGVNTQLIKRIVEKFNINVFVGGGVRYVSDLIELKNIGVSGVLLGTALYSKKISVEELKKNNLLA